MYLVLFLSWISFQKGALKFCCDKGKNRELANCFQRFNLKSPDPMESESSA